MGEGKLSLHSLIGQHTEGQHYEVILTHTNYTTGYVRKQGILLLRASITEPALLKSPHNAIFQTAFDKKATAALSPFEICITVFGAGNLPMDDQSSCDPFVVVYLDDIEIGRTKTVKGQLNPEWGMNGMGESFHSHALHAEKTASYYLYDAHLPSHNQYLGSLVLPLAALQGNNSNIRHPIAIVGDFQCDPNNPSYLEVSVEIIRNDSLIRIVSETNKAELRQSKIEMISNMLSTFLPSPSIAEAVYSTLEGLLSEEDAASQYLDRDLLRDLLQDIQTLTNTTTINTNYSILSDFIFKRDKLRILNARKIDFLTREESRYPPIEANSLQLNLSADCSRYVVVQLADRLSMWTWARWMFLLHDCWRLLLHESSPLFPSWAEGGEFQGQVRVYNSEGLSYSGRGCVSRTRPFQIKVNEFSFELAPMVSIILSADSESPKANILDMQIVSVSNTNKEEQTVGRIQGVFSGDNSKDNAVVSTEGFSDSPLPSPPGSVSGKVQKGGNLMRSVLLGAVKGASTVVSGVIDVTKEVANTTVNTARNIAASPSSSSRNMNSPY